MAITWPSVSDTSATSTASWRSLPHLPDWPPSSSLNTLSSSFLYFLQIPHLDSLFHHISILLPSLRGVSFGLGRTAAYVNMAPLPIKFTELVNVRGSLIWFWESMWKLTCVWISQLTSVGIAVCTRIPRESYATSSDHDTDTPAAHSKPFHTSRKITDIFIYSRLQLALLHVYVAHGCLATTPHNPGG